MNKLMCLEGIVLILRREHLKAPSGPCSISLLIWPVLICSVQLFSHVWLFATPWTAAHQASLSITTPWAYSNSYPSSRWYHPTISWSVVPFSSFLQSFPASWSFAMSQLFASGGQTTGASASASVLPKNIQDWSPLGWTALISLQSRGLSDLYPL